MSFVNWSHHALAVLKTSNISEMQHFIKLRAPFGNFPLNTAQTSDVFLVQKRYLANSGMPYVIRCFWRGKSNLKTVLESSKHLLSENICCPNFFWG